MRSNRVYLEELEARTIELLDESTDPKADMLKMAQAATEGGLIIDERVVRYGNAWQFAMDLFTWNPAAVDVGGAKRAFERLPDPPSRFDTIVEIASALRPTRSD